MAGTAIIRIEKHKSFSNLRGVLGHHLRTIPTNNADPERTPENQVLFGSDDVSAIVKKVKAITDPLAKRKDAVRAVELFLGASDEFWQNGGDWTVLGRSHLANLKAEFGEKNIIGMGVHLDEAMPHFWAIVTPVHDGSLKASHWFDGPKKLSDFQTRSAERLAHIGLDRGRKRTKGSHIDVRIWHQAQAGNKAAQKFLASEQQRRTADAETRTRNAEKIASDAERTARILRHSNALIKVETDGIMSNARTIAGHVAERQKAISEQLNREREVLAKERKRLSDLVASLTPVEEERAAAKLAAIRSLNQAPQQREAAVRAESQNRPNATPSVTFRRKLSPGG